MKLRIVLILCISVVLLIICGISWQKHSPSNDENFAKSMIANPKGKSNIDDVFPVNISIVMQGDLIKQFQTNGILRAHREIEVVAKVGGEIVDARVNNGKYVQRDDMLVHLDDRNYKMTFEKAKAALLGAQIEYTTMYNYLQDGAIDSIKINKSYKELMKKAEIIEKEFSLGNITEDSYDREKRNLETQLAFIKVNRSDVMADKSGLSNAREGYLRAKIDFEATRIQAPFSGYIADCQLTVGMQVEAGKILMKLVDVSSMLVDIEVLENEIGSIMIGQRVGVTVTSFPEKVFWGSVKYINPIVDIKAKTVKVTVELNNNGPISNLKSENRNQKLILRPGMFASVMIDTKTLKGQLLVPKQAVLVREHRTLVFKKEGDLAKWCYVDVGEENGKYVVIRSGISPDDTVIVGGHYTLAHDAKIRVIN